MRLLTYGIINLTEGTFWIVLAVVALIFYKKALKDYAGIFLASSFILLFLGISDFLEIEFGSFLEPGLWWLLIWKILCVLGLIVIIVWYFLLRIWIDRDTSYDKSNNF